MTHQVTVLGGSGYVGAEMLRLISTHPECELQAVSGDSTAGTPVPEVYPHLSEYQGVCFSPLSEALDRAQSCDVVFSCLPHGKSMDVLPNLSTRYVIDLGSDFRLLQGDQYQEWYGRPHSNPSLLKDWVYGLPELFRHQIQGANRVANPGCYPTAIALAAAPLIREGLIEADLVISAVSGTSGAGKGVAPHLHASHVHENLFAYKVGRHQHTPEIEMSLGEFSGKPVTVSFTPQVGPYVRGIYAVCSAKVVGSVSVHAPFECLAKAYSEEQFVTVAENPPHMKSVRGVNGAQVFATLDEHSGRIIMVGAIDNLVKGAAGQALQNFNIAAGLREELGLSVNGIYP